MVGGAMCAGGLIVTQTDATARPIMRLPMTVWVGFVLGGIAMGLCLAVVGMTLGFFFGGIVVVALLVPTLCLAERSLVHRLFIAGAVTDGVALLWLAGLLGSISIKQWCLGYALLICWAFALAGISHLLDRVIRNSLLASAIVVISALLWLSWPIWLSHLDLPLLISTHPLFALNGVITNFGVWTERPIAYQYLMRLNQDIPYDLPRSIAPAAGIHLLVGGIALLLGRVVGRS